MSGLTGLSPDTGAVRAVSRTGPARDVRVQKHLSRWLVGYAMTSIMAGLVLGWAGRGWTAVHSAGLGTLSVVAVFFVIYPTMVNLRLAALARAGRNTRGLLLALTYNVLWAPLVGYGLARIFLPDPHLALGFLLVMVVPCTNMSIAYTGLAHGNVELATVVMGSGLLLAVLTVPAWMALFADGYQVPLPLTTILVSITSVLVAPMVVGGVTRRVLVRLAGEGAPSRSQPILASVSVIAMFTVIFLIFFTKAELIVDRWAMVLLLLVPNALFVAVTLAVTTWLDRRLGLSYGDHMAVVFAATGKNVGTAIAIAAMAFPPLVAVPAATTPIFQVLLLVSYLRMAGRVRASFGEHPRVHREPAVGAVPS
jgi:ACR3 family arsenite efflux pump ArsB